MSILFTRKSSIQPLSTKGFTIVELLIVIVVIGILATITIIAYNGVQNKANDAAVVSDLSIFAKKAELFNLYNQTYPGVASGTSISASAFMTTMVSSATDAGAVKFSKNSYGSFFSSVNRDLFLYIVSQTSPWKVADYCVGAVSKSGQSYWITSRTPNPVKGPLGTPKDSATVANVSAQCESLLGYTPAMPSVAGIDIATYQP